MEKLVNVSFIVMLSSPVLLCISALFIASASKNLDFNKLDISRKIVIATMCVLLIGLIMIMTALIMIAIIQEKL